MLIAPTWLTGFVVEAGSRRLVQPSTGTIYTIGASASIPVEITEPARGGFSSTSSSTAGLTISSRRSRRRSRSFVTVDLPDFGAGRPMKRDGFAPAAG